MTSNLVLDTISNKLNIKYYQNVRMKDELIGKTVQENESGIIGLTDSNKDDKFNHWVAFYKEGNEKYYFCSFGSPITIELLNYLGKNILAHTFQIQPWKSVICGELCVLWLKLMSDGCKYEDIILNLFEDLNAFK